MKRNVLILVLVVGSAAVLQGWFLNLGAADAWSKSSDNSLALEYTRALASGHSYLLTPPDPRVLADPNPLSNPHLLMDASLYKGRYYLYFGVTPFLILLLPWFLVTGTFMPASAAIWVFCILGYLAYGGTLLVAAQRIGRKPGSAMASVVFIGLIACSGTLPLMARPAIYEVENAAAYALFGWALFAIAKAGCSERRRSKLMVATALAGLALSCRPNYFPAVGVLVVYVLYRSLGEPGRRSGLFSRIAWPLLPLAVVCLGIGWWNYHRFDSPTDFGVKQFFATDKGSGLLFTSARNIPYNAERYVAGAARLGAYFPFIEGQRDGHFGLAPGQQASNQVYGFLIFLPFLYWSLLVPFSRNGSRRPEFALSAGALALVCLGNLVFLSLIEVSSYRYPADFLGPIALLAGIGALSIEAVGRDWARRFLKLLLLVTVAWSACWAVFETAETARVHALFDLNRPGDFKKLAAPFNAIAYRLQRLDGSGPRALQLNLRFPEGKSGRVEPLLVTGEIAAQDFLYVYYTDSQTIQFGFESIGHGGRVSSPIETDYAAPHIVDIFLGTFLPPDDHPLLAGLSSADLKLLRRTVRITLDGKVVMEGTEELHPVRSIVFVGQSPNDAAFGGAFTGVISSTRRAPLTVALIQPDWSAGMFGPLALNFSISPMPTGSIEPLISVGYRPTGGMLALEHLTADEFSVDWMRFGKEAVRSSPFTLATNIPHRLEFSAGSLFPPTGSALWKNDASGSTATRKDEMLCRIDGRVIMDLEIDSPEASPHEIFIGKNTVGIQGVAQDFSGSILSSARQSW